MIKLTTTPIVKQVTQKDILLSQIQNGEAADDISEDEQAELAHQQKQEEIQNEQNKKPDTIEDLLSPIKLPSDKEIVFKDDQANSLVGSITPYAPPVDSKLSKNNKKKAK